MLHNMQPKTAIAKGKILEEWIVERLKMSGLDIRAYRQKGSGNGMNKGDVSNDLGICFEAKNQANFKPAWFDQAEYESMGTQEPVVVWHPPKRPLEASKVFMNWDYFEKILKKSKEPEMKNPDRAVRWKVQSLINAAKQLLKELE